MFNDLMLEAIVCFGIAEHFLLQYKTYMTVVRLNLTLSWFFNNNITLDMKFGHKWTFDEI